MDKKDLVLNKKKSFNIYILIAVALLVVAGLLIIPGIGSDKESNPDIGVLENVVKGIDTRYKIVEDDGGVVSFPLASFDNSVKYYQYKYEDTSVRFFILRSNDGTIRAAFDACDVCYMSRRGYDQVGDYMRCNNCGLTFPEDKINVVVGGCNPSPLTREIVGDNLIIKVEDIVQGKRFF